MVYFGELVVMRGLLVHNIDTRWSTVDQLIDVESGAWNKEVICKIVDREQASRIFNIPLVGFRDQDILVWCHDASGEYSVKSGYGTLRTRKTQYSKSKRTLRVDNVYPFCKEAPEDMDHLMWSCADENTGKLLTISFLALWHKRNKLRPPNPRTMKLNFDESFKGDTNISIAAVLARNAEGQIMGACTYPYTGVADAFVAEARAYERALCFVLDMGFRKLILERDSLTIIKKLNSNRKDRSILRPIS
ncbi:reverse transcriptase [Gossypium australe]|uniref:Reverse transcriptase n=1 Tax=Gossypium australe TaxID=47621 RepID=A0A5B6VEL3_9ROSI|nr:reverse transcriptase [Gossypium australe]